VPVPGLMNVELGGYHIGDIELSSAFLISTKPRSGFTMSPTRCSRLPITRIASPRRKLTGNKSAPGPDSTWARHISARKGRGSGVRSDRRAAWRCRRKRWHRDRRAHLPVGSQKATEFYRRTGFASRLRFRELRVSGVHRVGSRNGARASKSGVCRSSATTSGEPGSAQPLSTAFANLLFKTRAACNRSP